AGVAHPQHQGRVTGGGELTVGGGQLGERALRGDAGGLEHGHRLRRGDEKDGGGGDGLTDLEVDTILGRELGPGGRARDPHVRGLTLPQRGGRPDRLPLVDLEDEAVGGGALGSALDGGHDLGRGPDGDGGAVRRSGGDDGVVGRGCVRRDLGPVGGGRGRGHVVAVVPTGQEEDRGTDQQEQEQRDGTDEGRGPTGTGVSTVHGHGRKVSHPFDPP